VYTFNPAFRAERGRTRRHLTEFWMVEAELAFCQDLDQLFRLMEQLIRHVARALLDTSSADLALYAKAAVLAGSPVNNIENLLAGSPFHRITFRLFKFSAHDFCKILLFKVTRWVYVVEALLFK
jgi:aspartyl/asparaginyl-tRNA synthetase